MKGKICLSVIALLILSRLNAQQVDVPQLGSKAPAFMAQSTEGTINFPADYKGKWKIIFSHPKDFTPVCSSELLELAGDQSTFDKLGAQLIVVSTDLLEQHKAWEAALDEILAKDQNPVTIKFPFVADPDYKVSKLYGMIHTATSSERNIRGIYIIDPDNIIRSIQFYPNEVGRNLNEVIRTLQALEENYNHNTVETPADWKPGDDFIVPVLSSKEKAKLGTPGSPYYQKAWFLTYEKSGAIVK